MPDVASPHLRPAGRHASGAPHPRPGRRRPAGEHWLRRLRRSGGSRWTRSRPSAAFSQVSGGASLLLLSGVRKGSSMALARGRRRWLGALALVAACAAALAALLPPAPGATPRLADLPGDAAAGEYLARAGNCMACHTAEGGAPWAGGRALAPRPSAPSTPPISRPIRPPASGAGLSPTSCAPCARARRPDGSHLYPAFPYDHFARLTDADLAALWRFLRTLSAAGASRRGRPNCAFPTASGGSWRCGRRSFTIPGPSHPTRPARRSGTAAPTWSRGSPIAAPATRRAICWGPSGAAQPSPAAPSWTAPGSATSAAGPPPTSLRIPLGSPVGAKRRSSPT
ncbi:MAG: hypothetical protein KatS3mg124_1748 [Porticoccaceae bacterium]|nr:MAG: hypothetical protein KatS3mg124_1748 [Porticoccaceae bacterium]